MSDSSTESRSGPSTTESRERSSTTVLSGGSVPRDRNQSGRFRDRDTVLLAVAAVTVAALLARLVVLGARPAHWDEARVAYWALYAEETGHFAYRSIVHGPFVQHVSSWLFALFGPSDFFARLPVALVGGFLPLAALLFRDRLQRAETVALSLFLAFNPVLLYYSRFIRSDVLVGAFAFVALGLLVRFLDRRSPRYLYGTAFFLALAVASKENALIYLLTWIGAGALVIDRALDRPGSDRTGVDRVRAWIATIRVHLRRASEDARGSAFRYIGHALAAVVLFAFVWLFMFAPRGDGVQGLLVESTESIGLWEAVGDPSKWGPLIDTTVEQFRGEYLSWGNKSGSTTFEAYRKRLSDAVGRGLLGTSAPLVLFAVAGFVRERYGVAEGRVLVFFLFYAGAASVVGYPLGFSIGAGWKWNNVHVLLPLSIPAAVGVATIYRWGREAFLEDDQIDVGLTALVLLVTVSMVAWTALGTVYLNPQHESNDLVQFGQPHDDLGPVVDELREAAPSDDPDVLVYGNVSQDVSIVGPVPAGASWNVRPVCADFENFLPMQWYLSSADTNATCARTPIQLRETVERDSPPVVITRLRDDSAPTGWIEERYTHLGNFSLRYTERAI
ncbi:MAG: flippase activity-associated protein Agl23, partial [Halapricum sp.]